MQETGVELVFILDRSASMFGLEEVTVEHFNSMIEKQKKCHGECVVTTVLFDTVCETVHDGVNLKNMEPLEVSRFEPQGHTALMDAIGESIERVKLIHRCESGKEPPLQTIFVIITDGMENASKKYDADTVRVLIEEQTEKQGWRFLFLGANMDALSMACEIGIDVANAVTYVNDYHGIILNYEAVSNAIMEYRETGIISPAWKNKIAQCFDRRR